jgi:hypothetical protein
MFPDLFRKLRPFGYMGESDEMITAALLSEELAEGCRAPRPWRS